MNSTFVVGGLDMLCTLPGFSGLFAIAASFAALLNLGAEELRAQRRQDIET